MPLALGKRRLSSKIEGAINALVALHQVAPKELMTPPPAFSDAGVAAAERELQQLIKGVQVLQVAVARVCTSPPSRLSPGSVSIGRCL